MGGAEEKKWMWFPDPPTGLGRQKLSDNANHQTRSASNLRHGHPQGRLRELHQGCLPNNSPGNRGHVLRVRGKLFRVHRQLRQSPKDPVTQHNKRGSLTHSRLSRRSRGRQPSRDIGWVTALHVNVVDLALILISQSTRYSRRKSR